MVSNVFTILCNAFLSWMTFFINCLMSHVSLPGSSLEEFIIFYMALRLLTLLASAKHLTSVSGHSFGIESKLATFRSTFKL